MDSGEGWSLTGEWMPVNTCYGGNETGSEIMEEVG